MSDAALHRYLAFRRTLGPRPPLEHITVHARGLDFAVYRTPRVNDAPPLAEADVGIAMGAGSETALEAASVALPGDDLAKVVALIDLSRATASKIGQNLFLAFAYNVVMIPAAAAGMLSPVAAGAAMALSSVSVVTNALLLRNWKAR